MMEKYEDLKEMFVENQRAVTYKLEQFNKDVKGLTKEARQYKLQLVNYSEEINRNIKLIDKSVKQLKDKENKA
jgi:hypothetical protein